MRVLVTGAAGFIGFHLIQALKSRVDNITGIDNLNDYYDPKLKTLRLKKLGFQFDDEELLNGINCGTLYSDNIKFIKLDISNRELIKKLFDDERFDIVINLAAQAGVRYSIENPEAYIDSNLVGFANILEGCRNTKVRHLLYASSSSVYGMNKKQPFSVEDQVDYPISLYAATKKSNELMAHTYSHLYGIPTTGLRFFTVYGPFGRPDMAYFSFTKAILSGAEINVFNNGHMKRDFTYIDDIIESIVNLINSTPSVDDSHQQARSHFTGAQAPYRVYNIGNNRPITLSRFIAAIESACGSKAIKKLLPMQSGDVPITYANVDPLILDIKFKPETEIEAGICKFVSWYNETYS